MSDDEMVVRTLETLRRLAAGGLLDADDQAEVQAIVSEAVPAPDEPVEEGLCVFCGRPARVWGESRWTYHLDPDGELDSPGCDPDLRREWRARIDQS